MWVRQCDLDAAAEAPSPIPTRIASNEEFIPPPQTLEQKAFEARLTEISEKHAKGQGLSRRAFHPHGHVYGDGLVAIWQKRFGDFKRRTFAAIGAEVGDDFSACDETPGFHRHQLGITGAHA